MEKRQAEMMGKLKILSFTLNKTKEIMERRDQEASERQEMSIMTKIKAINSLEGETEELKFINRESNEQVQE